MVRYFMQLRDGTGHLLDPEGIEYADIDVLKKKVLIAVRELISGTSRAELSIYGSALTRKIAMA